MRRPKHAAMLPNGRSDVKSFSEVFSKSMKVGVVASPAFRQLTSSAKSVLFICYAKNDHGKHHKRKDEKGKPVFEFQRQEAQALLGMGNRTFLDSLNQLRKLGFIEDANPGNDTLKCNRGVPNQYRLCNKWRTVSPEPTDRELLQQLGDAAPPELVAKIEQRRIAGLYRLGRIKQLPEPVRDSTQVKQQFEQGQKVGFYKEGTSKRAVYGYIVSQIEGGWRILGLRTAKEYNPPSYDIPDDRIVLIEKMNSRKNRKPDHSEQKPGVKLHTRTRVKVCAVECTG